MHEPPDTRYLVLKLPGGRSGVHVRGRSFESATRGMDAGEASGAMLETVTGDAAVGAELRADPDNAFAIDCESTFSLIRPIAPVVAASDAPDAETFVDRVDGMRLAQGLVAVRAHETNYTGKGVTVAVLDTGINAAHAAFAGKRIVARNFTNEGNELDVTDNDGHGTHCAATICAGSVDGVRLGVAPGIDRLCVGKIIGRYGGSAEALIRGLIWAVVEQKADVVSMSIGYDLPGNAKRLAERGLAHELATKSALRQQEEILRSMEALRLLFEVQAPGTVLVAASGNESERPLKVLDAALPASTWVPVGAVERKGEAWDIAKFSNGRVKYVAPGVNVVAAAREGGLGSMSGTSMATPHVTGVAALWAQKLKEENELGVRGALAAHLQAHASKKRLLNRDPNTVGSGMVQAPVAD